MKQIGIISDTHSLVRPEAVDALRGCDLLIHAGDIGKATVLDELNQIAPVVAIRGNIDKWANELPDNEVVEVEGRYIYVLHNLRELDLDPGAAGFDVVVTGHSHKPSRLVKEGVLYLNPGSAGPRRFTLPVAVAKLSVSPDLLDAKIIELEV